MGISWVAVLHLGTRMSAQIKDEKEQRILIIPSLKCSSERSVLFLFNYTLYKQDEIYMHLLYHGNTRNRSADTNVAARRTLGIR